MRPERTGRPVAAVALSLLDRASEIAPGRRRRSRRARAALLAVLLCATWFPGTRAAEGDVDPDAPGLAPHERYEALMKRVARRQASLRSLEARFLQRKESPLLLAPEIARGNLVFRAPDRARWDFETPEALVVVHRGRELAIRYPETGEIERRALDPRAGRLLELFGPGASLEKLRPYFTIRVTFPDDRDAPYRLALEPSVEQVARRVRAIELHVDRALLVPVFIRTVDGAGGVTELVFSDLVLDREIPDARFELDP